MSRDWDGRENVEWSPRWSRRTGSGRLGRGYWFAPNFPLIPRTQRELLLGVPSTPDTAWLLSPFWHPIAPRWGDPSGEMRTPLSSQGFHFRNPAIQYMHYNSLHLVERPQENCLTFNTRNSKDRFTFFKKINVVCRTKSNRMRIYYKKLRFK